MIVRIALAIILVVATTGTVRSCHQDDDYEKAMTECIKWATANVIDVDASAWCQP